MSKHVVHIIKQVICTEGAEQPWRRWPHPPFSSVLHRYVSGCEAGYTSSGVIHFFVCVFTFLVLPLISFLLLRPSHSSRTPELASAVTAAVVQGAQLNPLKSSYVLSTYRREAVKCGTQRQSAASHLLCWWCRKEVPPKRWNVATGIVTSSDQSVIFNSNHT